MQAAGYTKIWFVVLYEYERIVFTRFSQKILLRLSHEIV